jgi:excisionase family DNA binding protein
MPKDHVTAAEAANILGCSESYIRKRIQRGTLRGVKVQSRWHIARADLDVPHERDTVPHDATPVPHGRDSVPYDATPVPHERDSVPHPWRDDLLAQVARLEANEDHWRNEMERSKARAIDLERELTVRDSRMVDLQAKQEFEVTELRGQVAVLEAKVREVLEKSQDILEKGQDEALGLANRIADLVDRQQEADARIHELQPVAEQVPMLQAAVEEKDATLSEREQALQDREQELGNMRQDIDAIASRPVTGPVFRLLTKGRLRI